MTQTEQQINEQSIQSNNKKKAMLVKLTGEELYTKQELDTMMIDMHRKFELEIERSRIAEKLYKEMLFKVLKIEENKPKYEYGGAI